MQVQKIEVHKLYHLMIKTHHKKLHQISALVC